MTFTVALSVAVAVAIVTAMRSINTPEAVIPRAASCLRIILAGLAFAFLCNFLSSALCSVGEAAMLLVFLILASVLNIALAVFFVDRLGYGIRGKAEDLFAPGP